MTHPNPAAARYALLSVSDKTGLAGFARALDAAGYRLISTGGTATALRDAGLDVTAVSDLTGFPEIMAGRVKTLHPLVHGGLLGRPGVDEAVMAELGIPSIDVLVLNLYPFEATVAREGCSLDEAVENIDIGGPAMLRAAAKNFARVAVVTDPGQYPALEEQLAEHGAFDEATRFRLSVAAFNHVARYDAAIAGYLSSLDDQGERGRFPGQASPVLTKMGDLRYGENPHQPAAWYREADPAPGSLVNLVQLQGKPLSYNNLADADAAWAGARRFERPSCVIVKHANPCGVASADGIAAAYDAAFAGDPTSAFGGIIAVNRALDAATARAVLERQFVEVLIAPAVEEGAREVLAAKPNVRVLEIPGADAPLADTTEWRSISGGMLAQAADIHRLAREDCRVVTRAQPDDAQWADLLFAWTVAQLVKSNAIVYAAGERTLGIGAGQMSRVDSARIGRWKARDAGFDLAGSVLASDAFFPFRDGIDTAAEAGVRAVIQPGGSMRDDEVIAAADEHKLAMVFTGIRHFKH